MQYDFQTIELGSFTPLLMRWRCWDFQWQLPSNLGEVKIRKVRWRWFGHVLRRVHEYDDVSCGGRGWGWTGGFFMKNQPMYFSPHLLCSPKFTVKWILTLDLFVLGCSLSMKQRKCSEAYVDSCISAALWPTSWQMDTGDVKYKQRGQSTIVAVWFVSCYLPFTIAQVFYAWLEIHESCRLR